MTIQKDSRVTLKSFWGTLNPKSKTTPNEDFWKLIGEKGKVISGEETDERVLVLFENDLDHFKVENHNPIKNSLWIKKTDLEISAE